MLRFITTGESHGKQLTAVVEGLPAGIKISGEDIDQELHRRQQGYGRGARMSIEKDRVEFVSGVRLGETLGSPVTMVIKNLDWQNWGTLMGAEPAKLSEKYLQIRPRPGHADLPGALKYNRKDLRDILERSSARETAARVALGVVCKVLLRSFGVDIYSFTSEIGGASAEIPEMKAEAMRAIVEKSAVRTPDAAAEKKMIEVIKAAGERGDTVGGIFTVIASGVVPGLGSHVQWDRKLDADLARALMSIQAVKGVEFGAGFAYAEHPGSEVHDEIFYSQSKGFYRNTNFAGGIEGGMSNGEDIIVSCVMKPIPSLKKPLRSVKITTKKADMAEAVRSDVCAVPAAGIVGEAAVACTLADAWCTKFGGDSLQEMKNNYNAYCKQIKSF
jgi:chorismate synthase